MDGEDEQRATRDRRTDVHFKFLDRRGGFDRRKRYPILGTLRDSSWALIALLVLLNVLSIADGALTAAELLLGIAQEGNPVFGPLISASPLLAAGFKVIVMLLVSIGIWRGRRYRAILAVAPLALALYAMLLAYHVGSLSGYGVF